MTFGASFGNGGAKDVGRNFSSPISMSAADARGSQEILLEGAPNTTPDINRGMINPPVDSVQKCPLTSFARHQFGANLDGPILKNRVFLLGDYKGLRRADGR